MALPPPPPTPKHTIHHPPLTTHRRRRPRHRRRSTNATSTAHHHRRITKTATVGGVVGYIGGSILKQVAHIAMGVAALSFVVIHSGLVRREPPPHRSAPRDSTSLHFLNPPPSHLTPPPRFL